MVNATYPEDKLEYWHAIFEAPIDDAIDVIIAAQNYGIGMIDCGLAKDYATIARPQEDKYVVHCIPHDGRGSANYYYGLLFDKKSLIC